MTTDQFRPRFATPDEFAELMRDIAGNADRERAHLEADTLLCELLLAFGYTEAVRIYRDMMAG